MRGEDAVGGGVRIEREREREVRASVGTEGRG